MIERYVVELEPEVRMWLESLPIAEYRRVAEMADLLAVNATTLDEPYAKSLGDGVRELRIRLHPLSMRLTYWVAPQRRVVLLTVFATTRDRETAEGRFRRTVGDRAYFTSTFGFRLPSAGVDQMSVRRSPGRV